MTQLKLAIATSSEHKFAELAVLLKSDHWQISQLNLELTEIQELDLLAITQHKLQEAIAACPKNIDLVLVDDTALCLDVLGGLPGPFIKWFLKSMGPTKLAALTKENSLAQAISVLGLAERSSSKTLLFKGEICGQILNGVEAGVFGWDSIFKPLQGANSFAEMSFEQKNRFSHRALAAKNLMRYVNSHRENLFSEG